MLKGQPDPDWQATLTKTDRIRLAIPDRSTKVGRGGGDSSRPNPFFGPVNAHQWVLYIPLHHDRHNQQIAEVKATTTFPR